MMMQGVSPDIAGTCPDVSPPFNMTRSSKPLPATSCQESVSRKVRTLPIQASIHIEGCEQSNSAHRVAASSFFCTSRFKLLVNESILDWFSLRCCLYFASCDCRCCTLPTVLRSSFESASFSFACCLQTCASFDALASRCAFELVMLSSSSTIVTCFCCEQRSSSCSCLASSFRPSSWQLASLLASRAAVSSSRKLLLSADVAW
mmetsp:Transcript_116115/g.275935  ORF Transcript_116115/g.275935 Transcript_116115/m.275935 type:complete len:204 (-) Transcript_116115:564-1175(-)